METKLKVRLELFEKTVVLQILEQTEKFRCIDLETPFLHETSTMMCVRSVNDPALMNFIIFLRGQKTYGHFQLCQNNFSNNQERDAYFLNVKESLNHWRKHCKLLQEEKLNDEDFWIVGKEYELLHDTPNFPKGTIFCHEEGFSLSYMGHNTGIDPEGVTDPHKWFKQVGSVVPQIPVDLSTGTFTL